MCILNVDLTEVSRHICAGNTENIYRLVFIEHVGLDNSDDQYLFTLQYIEIFFPIFVDGQIHFYKMNETVAVSIFCVRLV